MIKKKTPHYIILMIIFLVLLAAIIFFVIKTNENEPVQEIKCAKEGEYFSKVYRNQYPQVCCYGLYEWDSGFDTRISIGNSCYETKLLAGSPVGMCIKVNDGVCSHLENPCNSPQDCKDGKNANYISNQEFCEKAHSTYCSSITSKVDSALCRLC